MGPGESLAGTTSSAFFHSRGQRCQDASVEGLRRRIDGRKSFHCPRARPCQSPCSGQPATTLHWPQSGPLTARGFAIAVRTTATRSSNQLAQRVDVGLVEHGLAEVAAYEVGPHDTQRIGADPAGESQHREPDRFELGRFGRGAPAPEVELTELLAAGLVDHGEVDPSADPQRAARRVGGGVETVVVEHHRTVAEQLDVPPCRLREHRLLFGLQRVADPGEVGDHRRAELGVDVADRLEEHLPQSRPVHRVVGAGAAVDLLRQTPRAHGVGAAQQVGRDLGQWVRLHRAEATALESGSGGFPRGPGAVGTHS